MVQKPRNGLFKTCTNLCFLADDYVNIYFHPWEFVNLKDWKIPIIFKRNTGKKLYEMLENYIEWLIHKKVEFITLNESSKGY